MEFNQQKQLFKQACKNGDIDSIIKTLNNIKPKTIKKMIPLLLTDKIFTTIKLFLITPEIDLTNEIVPIIKSLCEHNNCELLNIIIHNDKYDLSFERNWFLRWCCEYGKINFVKLLLKKQEIIDSLNKSGRKYVFTKLEHIEIAEIIQQHSISPISIDSIFINPWQRYANIYFGNKLIV